ncbi:MAG: AGE family epimerase/isomerase [Bacteroidota bacterium]
MGDIKSKSRNILLILVWILVACSGEPDAQKKEQMEMLSQIEGALDQVAKAWYPRVVDTIHGGFWTNFAHNWEKQEEKDKMLVTQARHVWTASTLAAFYQDKSYEEIGDHGYRFLRDRMWDTQNGGFHTVVQAKRDGGILPVSKTKSVYANAFAIYGLAAYYKISGDIGALELAQKAFQWLEEHAHDPEHKGYFDILEQDGSWLWGTSGKEDEIEEYVRKDWKDQNSSIHLLECFTALYDVWPDPIVKKRLHELLELIRDTICTEKGTLTLHLERDWTPVSLRDSSATYRKENFWLDHVSFGHDVETAFLMLEAQHVLKETNIRTLMRAKKMVDHALEWGWDMEYGGFYEGGYDWGLPQERVIESPAKVWWVQAEGFNTLLLFSRLFPKEDRYWKRALEQWGHIHSYMIDHEYGGWFHEGLDTDPEAKHAPKAYRWKVNYHVVRALVNTIQMLKGEFPLLVKNEHNP